MLTFHTVFLLEFLLLRITNAKKKFRRSQKMKGYVIEGYVFSASVLRDGLFLKKLFLTVTDTRRLKILNLKCKKMQLIKWTWQPYLQSTTSAVPSWHLLPSADSDIPSGQAQVVVPVGSTKQKWLHWTFEDLHGVVTVFLPLPNYVVRRDNLLSHKYFLVNSFILLQFVFEWIFYLFWLTILKVVKKKASKQRPF